MNNQGLIQDAEFLTNLGVGAISGNTNLLKDFTRRMNIWLHKVATMILVSQDDWTWDDANNTTTYPIATAPLVAGQRDYTLPSTVGILRIKRIDISYDGTTYNKVWSIDDSQMPFGLGNDTTTDGHFSKSRPYFDPQANAVFIYPEASASDVANGGLIRLIYIRDVTEFNQDGSSTTQKPGFDAIWHGMVSCGAAFDWCLAKELPKAESLAGQLADWEGRLKQYYGSKDSAATYIAKPFRQNMR